MPVIYYSPFRYWIGIALAAVTAIIMLLLGFTDRQWIFFAVGLFSLAFGILFWQASRSKLRPGAVALTNKDGFLVGGELVQPLPVAQTSFELKNDNQGSWVINLFHQDQKITLGAGGWRTKRESHITKVTAERLLLELGLAKRS